MMRKASKKSRAANAAERAFIGWTKDQVCVCCGDEPCTVQHAEGSSFRLRVDLISVLIGHWFVIPLCQLHDQMVTHNKREFIRRYSSQSSLWLCHYSHYLPQTCPLEVVKGIRGHWK